MAGMLPPCTDFVAVTRACLAGNEPRALELDGWMAAAVLLLILRKAGRDHVLLTRRTDTVEHHKGQISFPGGAVHPADADLETTALRETYEEVGIDPQLVEVLGRLDDMVTVSHFRVTPVVGVLAGEPGDYIPSPIEVAEVIEVPITHLLDPANVLDHPHEVDGRLVPGPAYLYEGHRVWGATARMLRAYLDLIAGSLDASGTATENQAGDIARHNVGEAK